jgi:hypothetical protein
VLIVGSPVCDVATFLQRQGCDIPAGLETVRTYALLRFSVDSATWFGGFNSPRGRPSPQTSFVSFIPSLESTFPRLTVYFEPQGGRESESVVVDSDSITKCVLTRGSITEDKVRNFVKNAHQSAGLQLDSNKKDFTLLTIDIDTGQPGVRFQDTRVPLPKSSPTSAVVEIAERTACMQFVFPTESRNINVIDYWKFLITDLRDSADPTCGRTNNWWYTKQENFDIARFQSLNGLGGFDWWSSNNAAPPHFPWTEVVTRTDSTYSQVYPAMIDLDLRPRFPNLRVFESLLLPGLLWEREYAKVLYQRQFNSSTPYRVITNQSSHRIRGAEVFVAQVRIPDDVLQHGGNFLLPPERSRMIICFSGVGENVEGTVVRSSTRCVNPFLIVFHIRPGAPGAGTLPATWTDNDVRLHFDLHNVTMNRVIHSVQTAAKSGNTPSSRGPLLFSPFSLNTFICGRPPNPLSPRSKNFVLEYYEYSRDNDVTIQATITLVTRTLPSNLNEKQTEVYRAFLAGSPNAVVLLEGLPGTGKTTVVARAIIALMMMKVKVIATAQARYAVDAILRKVLTEAARHNLQNVVEPRMTRFLAPSQDTNNSSISHWFAGKPVGTNNTDDTDVHTASDTDLLLQEIEQRYEGVDPLLVAYTLNRKVRAWANDNPATDLGKAFLNYEKADKARRSWKITMPYGEVVRQIEKLLLKESFIIGATCSAASLLYNRDYKAGYVFFDEASQVSLSPFSVA